MRRRALYRKNSGGTSGTYLLDTYPAAFALSFRKLSASHTVVLQAIKEVPGGNDDIQDLIVDKNNTITVNGVNYETWANSENVDLRNWRDAVSGSILVYPPSPSVAPNLSDFGTVRKVNNKYATYWTGSDRMDSPNNTAISALDYGKDFTVYAVTNSWDSNYRGGIFSTSTSSVQRLSMFHDTRTNKSAASVETDTGDFFSEYSVRQDGNLSVQVMQVQGDTLKTWNNGIAGSTINFTGTYNNDEFILGARRGAGDMLKGNILEFLVFEGAHDTATRQAIENDIITYYNIT